MYITSVTLSQGSPVYMRNQIPQLLLFCDKIIYVLDHIDPEIIDEWKNYEKVIFVEKKWVWDFSEMHNFALQFVPIGSWYFKIDDDEIVSEDFISRIREELEKCEEKGIERVWPRVFELLTFDTCIRESFYPLRIMKRIADLHFVNQVHEVPKATWTGVGTKLPDAISLIHLKYLDKLRIQDAKTRYVQNGMYPEEYVEMKMETEPARIPAYLKFALTSELRRYLQGETNE